MLLLYRRARPEAGQEPQAVAQVGARESQELVILLCHVEDAVCQDVLEDQQAARPRQLLCGLRHVVAFAQIRHRFIEQLDAFGQVFRLGFAYGDVHGSSP
jgi:hypothetical protein